MQQRKKLHYVKKMYQTKAHRLNIIEKEDAFSPEPLNDNTQKVEGALSAVTAHADAGDQAEAAARQAADAALGQRITALEARRVVLGSYQGNNSPLTIQLGFTPASVFLFRQATVSFTVIRLMIQGEEYTNLDGTLVEAKIVNGGFYVRTGVYNSEAPYFFVAIA